MIDAPQVTTPATRLPDSKPSGTAAGRHRQNLIWALALTSAFMAIEVVGGLWTGSLALLADAGHMLTDVAGLVMALITATLMTRPASATRAWGWRRAEILGAARRRPQLAARLGQSQHEVNVQLCEIARVGQERGVLDPSLDPMALSLFVQAFTFGLLLAEVDPATELDPDAWLDVVSRFTSSVTYRA